MHLSAKIILKFNFIQIIYKLFKILSPFVQKYYSIN